MEKIKSVFINGFVIGYPDEDEYVEHERLIELYYLLYDKMDIREWEDEYRECYGAMNVDDGVDGVIDETIITFFKHLSAQLKTLQNNNSLTVMFSDMEIPEGDCVIGWTQEGPQDTDNLNKILIENGYIIKEKIEKPFYFIGGETLERD